MIILRGMVGPSTFTSDLAFGALLDVLHDVVFVYDDQLVCRHVGRGARSLFDLDPAAIRGQTRAEVLAKIASTCSELQPVVSALNERAASSERVELEAIDIAGPPWRSIAWTTSPIVHAGVIVGRIDLARDVTRLRKLEEAALLDPLTGLGNVRRFEEECEREHRRAQRVWDSYAVARIDVDGMAAINTAFGREKGDVLLRLLGERLRASRRQYDIVARWSNDDFALLLPAIDRTAVKRVLERAALQAVDAAREAGFTIHLNVGVAVWTPPSADSASDVLSRATTALVAARETGPGSVHVDLDGTTVKDDPFAGIGEPPPRVD